MECVLEPHKPSSAPADGRTGVRGSNVNKCNNVNNSGAVNVFADTLPCASSNTEEKPEIAEYSLRKTHECDDDDDRKNVECSNKISEDAASTEQQRQKWEKELEEQEERASGDYLGDVNACPAMHDVEFYAQVAKELGVAAPVLHSVVYTHRHFEQDKTNKPSEMIEQEEEELEVMTVNDDNTTDKAQNENSSRNISKKNKKITDHIVENDQVEFWPIMRKRLNAELHKVNEHVYEWEARRMQEIEIAKLSANLHCQETLEEQMRRRIEHKREMEQMRAVNRMNNLTREMAIDLHRMKVSLIPHADKHKCLFSSSQSEFSSSSSSSSSLYQSQPEENCHCNEEKNNEVYECKDKETSLRHAAKAHIAALREVQTAELTKHRLYRLEQERFLCNQSHDIGKLAIEQEEMHKRRAIGAQFLSMALLINLAESEGKRRMLLEGSECNQWNYVIERFANVHL